MMTNLLLAETPSDLSKSQRVYTYLRRRIRELKIPPGSILNKNEIALEIGVSRAPVSEAIARLAREGLVDIFPQNGSFVSPIRPLDIRESLFIRTALEVATVKRVTLLRDKELQKRLEDIIEAQADALKEPELDLVRYDDLDEALHAEIVGAVDLPHTQHLLEAARVLLDRPRFLTLPVDHRPEDTYYEHRRIVDAIGTGDAEFAGAAMKAHLTNVSQAIEVKLAQIEQEDD
jgi:DNA-binding GntR family transcriptional regulator